MEKLTLHRAFLDPKNGYKLVSKNAPGFYVDQYGNGLILVGETPEKLISTFIVEGATNAIWFKKLKELGIEFAKDAKEVEVSAADEEVFSFKNGDGTFTVVPNEQVLKNAKNGTFYVVSGPTKITSLYRRVIKRYFINGVDVGNEYMYKKLLGFEVQPTQNPKK
jgi:hypothetical protein